MVSSENRIRGSKCKGIFMIYSVSLYWATYFIVGMFLLLNQKQPEANEKQWNRVVSTW